MTRTDIHTHIYIHIHFCAWTRFMLNKLNQTMTMCACARQGGAWSGDSGLASTTRLHTTAPWQGHAPDRMCQTALPHTCISRCLACVYGAAFRLLWREGSCVATNWHKCRECVVMVVRLVFVLCIQTSLLLFYTWYYMPYMTYMTYMPGRHDHIMHVMKAYFCVISCICIQFTHQFISSGVRKHVAWRWEFWMCLHRCFPRPWCCVGCIHTWSSHNMQVCMYAYICICVCV